MLNYKFFITVLTVTLFSLSACSSSDNGGSTDTKTASLQLSTKSISVAKEGGATEVSVTSNMEWAAVPSASWLKVSPESGLSGTTKMTVTASENATAGEPREGFVVVRCGGTHRDTIKVAQAAPEKEDVGDITCPIGSEYKLVWHDEFDSGDNLSSDWTYEVQNKGWVNNELQYYVNQKTSKGTKVTTVSDGTLKINCLKETNVYSARVYACKKTGWKYGYIEAKIKLPKGKGTWPAFWMMPVNYTSWPADGEIDIMEEVGCDPNVVVSTIHCTKYNNSGTSKESARKTVSTAQSEFHTYGLEWTADYMVFYVDNVKLLTYSNDGTGKDAWPFNAAFYPILNLAWGGDWGGMNGVDESCLPATMEVDYVRVFQK